MIRTFKGSTSVFVLWVGWVAWIWVLPGAIQAQDSSDKTDLDRAIERGLQYLKRSQQADGSWNRDAAITSLSVMAILSAGYVPGEGPFAETLDRGIRWVLKIQQPNGVIATNGSYEMYHHGIATLMLAEVVGMTQGPLADEVRSKLEKAVQLILRAQRKSGHHKGGWRYRWNATDSDISVTGWQMLALRAAKNVGADVPAAAIADAVDYVKRCRDTSTGAFRYNPGGSRTVPCTGTSILALEICGKQEHHSPEVLKAGSFLLRKENYPRWGHSYFYYSNYYCSQATFQLGGNYWSFYRPLLHKAILPNQKEDGRWEGGGSDSRFGPAYCTAMTILALSVEYRYLPIYQRDEQE
ncbi:MAG: hypothetical protein KatS3mg105_2747 [Gemmatales bacterium]|nr:MAG: hypothetical protein KatS3mg105_2747 [Gemmatales bacterium]